MFYVKLMKYFFFVLKFIFGDILYYISDNTYRAKTD